MDNARPVVEADGPCREQSRSKKWQTNFHLPNPYCQTEANSPINPGYKAVLGQYDVATGITIRSQGMW